MPSKMVTDRQKSARAVQKAALVHADKAAAGLTPLLATVLQEGQAPPDVAGYLRLLGLVVERHRQQMVEADEAHEAELADDLDPRRRRDEAVFELRDRLIGVRQMLDAIYGAKKSFELVGISGEVSADPDVLQRQAQTALAKIRLTPVAALPPSRLPGVVVEPAAWEGLIQPALESLVQALDAVAEEKREAEATLIAKNQAIEAYDNGFFRIARVLEATFAAAGLTELAARVRPSRRRPGRTAEEPEGEEPEPETPAPEPPAPQFPPPAAPGASS